MKRDKRRNPDKIRKIMAKFSNLCPRCRGNGTIGKPPKPCPQCGGTGRIVVKPL